MDRNTAVSCAVIIPCHNEEDNIGACVRRVPALGASTEVIVVDDGSTDRTADTVRGLMAGDPRVRLITYPKNRGKGYAVKQGFDAAHSDVIMVLDADMTVEPEELPLFVDAMARQGTGLINGTRFKLPREDGAMSGLHAFGNRVFTGIISWLTRSKLTDTLCGTKVLFKNDYLKISMGKCPWGDFDLLFGIAKLRQPITEVPVHYKKRVAGQSKMKTFRHGWQLLKMCFHGFKVLRLGKA